MEHQISISSSAGRFLEMIKASRRGKLKIYLGLAAGVGKTYRMLLEGHELVRDHINVFIGFIETHGRRETAKLLDGLPAIKRKQIFYKGKQLEEMDIDSILLQKPEVVLVDELAHTNVPGSKNEKRWRDINELIDAGINVITTLNIQHIESINEQVEKITGVKVSERVPDSVIQSADEVVNVDLTIDELLDRLKEGKIYDLNKVSVALRNFFQEDKLLQLRDLALKEVSSHVSNKVYNELSGPQREKKNAIITCVSTNNYTGSRLIRRSARFSNIYGSNWFVVYVKTPKESVEKVSAVDQRHLIQNFKLAKELGAEVIELQSHDVAKAVADFAREKEAGVIIMGKPHFSILTEIMNKSIFKKLIDYTLNLKIDILLVTNNEKYKS
jgi:two-component system, OmpR family, sensor histidine kinase KdpD